MKNKDT